MTGVDCVAAMTQELRCRLPNPSDQQTKLILENDLVGRAILALLWPHRCHLSVYLVSEDPSDRHVLAVREGLVAVRQAPEVAIVSRCDAVDLVADEHTVIWALEQQRTPSGLDQALRSRSVDATFLPFFEPFQALGEQAPSQTVVEHELILRDMIRAYVPFLNFFGDRVHPQDLYERSKYPEWISPPEDFMAGLPQLHSVVRNAQSEVTATAVFAGTLALNASDVLQDQSVSVELGTVFDLFDAPCYDATVTICNAYSNVAGQGTLAIEVHHDGKLVTSVDVASPQSEVQVPIGGISTGSSLTVSLVALKDNPKTSWAQASATQVRLHVHPAGTYSVPRFGHRARMWLRRFTNRRPRVA